MLSLVEQWFSVLIAAMTAILTIVGTAVTVSTSLSSKLSDLRTLIFTRTEDIQKNILEKLEYHEKHDDKRFSELKNDITLIRIRNAARDGHFDNKEKEISFTG